MSEAAGKVANYRNMSWLISRAYLRLRELKGTFPESRRVHFPLFRPQTLLAGVIQFSDFVQLI